MSFFNDFKNINQRWVGFLLLFMLTLTITLRSEYILYRIKDGKQLKLFKREHAQAFKILMKYQFPMSQMLFLGREWDDIPEDEQKELNELLQDEQAFIQKKLDELKLNVKIAFMPTTLYELLFIKLSLDDATKCFTEYKDDENLFSSKVKDENRDFAFYQKIHYPLGARNLYRIYQKNLPAQELLRRDYKSIKKLDLIEDWDINKYFKKVITINNAAENIHYLFNNRIVGYLSSLDMLKLLEQEFYEKLEQDLFNKFETFPEDVKKLGETNFYDYRLTLKNFDKATELCKETKALSWFYKLFEKEETKNRAKSIISSCIQSEYLTHKGGDWLLYRGTDPLDWRGKVIDKLPANYSLCYGNSLFGGILREHHFGTYGGHGFRGGACAFSYCMGPHKLNLLQRINIKNYCKKQEEYSLFNITPYTILIDIAVLGEDFHPRNKVYIDPKKSPLKTIEGRWKSGDCELNSHYLVTNLFGIISEKAFIEKRDTYLKDHQIIITQPKYLRSIESVAEYYLKQAKNSAKYKNFDLYKISIQEVLKALSKVKQKILGNENLLSERKKILNENREKLTDDEIEKKWNKTVRPLIKKIFALKDSYKKSIKELQDLLTNDYANLYLENVVPAMLFGELAIDAEMQENLQKALFENLVKREEESRCSLVKKIAEKCLDQLVVTTDREKILEFIKKCEESIETIREKISQQLESEESWERREGLATLIDRIKNGDNCAWAKGLVLEILASEDQENYKLGREIYKLWVDRGITTKEKLTTFIEQYKDSSEEDDQRLVKNLEQVLDETKSE